MKIIDLLNKIAKGERIPSKVLIRDVVYYLINNKDGDITYSTDKDGRNWEAFIDNRLNITRCLNEDVLILDGGVEILEDEEEIDINNIEELVGEVNVKINNKIVNAEDLFYTISNIIKSIGSLKNNQNKMIKYLKQKSKQGGLKL